MEAFFTIYWMSRTLQQAQQQRSHHMIARILLTRQHKRYGQPIDFSTRMILLSGLWRGTLSVTSWHRDQTTESRVSGREQDQARAIVSKTDTTSAKRRRRPKAHGTDGRGEGCYLPRKSRKWRTRLKGWWIRKCRRRHRSYPEFLAWAKERILVPVMVFQREFHLQIVCPHHHNSYLVPSTFLAWTPNSSRPCSEVGKYRCLLHQWQQDLVRAFLHHRCHQATLTSPRCPQVCFPMGFNSLKAFLLYQGPPILAPYLASMLGVSPASPVLAPTTMVALQRGIQEEARSDDEPRYPVSKKVS